MSITVDGEEFEEEIDMNECDKCGASVYPNETYVTGIDRQLCIDCFTNEYSN